MFVNSSVKQVKTTDKILTNDLFLSKKKKISHMDLVWTEKLFKMWNFFKSGKRWNFL